MEQTGFAWGDGNGANPTRSIKAYGTKIYEADWNRFHPEKIMICSLDKTIMFLDCNDSGMTSMFLFCGLFGPKDILQTPKLT
jgi:hypothetical protein